MKSLSVSSLNWIIDHYSEILPNSLNGDIYYIPFKEFKSVLYIRREYVNDTLSIIRLLDIICRYLVNEMYLKYVLNIGSVNIVYTDLILNTPEDISSLKSDVIKYYDIKRWYNDSEISNNILKYWYNISLLNGEENG